MNNENSENSVEGDHQSLINILLQNPEDFNLKQKPSGIYENKMFTLGMREIPISSAKADDNGAYISKGSVTKSYMYNEEASHTSHKDGNGVWYVNIYSTLKVTAKKLFQETKCTTRAILSPPEVSPQLKVMLKKNQGLFMLSHTNGQMGRINTLTFLGTGMLPDQPVVYRKDPSLFSKVDNLIGKGLSTDQVYNSIARAGASTVSQAIPGPKLIQLS